MINVIQFQQDFQILARPTSNEQGLQLFCE
jgi:hypothetical protein